MSYFSDKIKKLRLEKGLTQKQIAEEIGVAQSTYSNIESGNTEPSLKVLERLSDYYEEFADTLIRPFRIIDEDDLTEKEQKLLQAYNKLTGNDQDEIMSIIELKLSKYYSDKKEIQ